MKSLASPVEMFIVKLSLATMLTVLLSLLFWGSNGALHVNASGCSNTYAYYGIRAGSNNYFGVETVANCYMPSSGMYTYFEASGSASYIAAQRDTWLTQLPNSSGTRYGETGRSSVVAYPTNGQYYYVQHAYYGVTLSPEWGCVWYNLPDYYISVDYNCSDMT